MVTMANVGLYMRQTPVMASAGYGNSRPVRDFVRFNSGI